MVTQLVDMVERVSVAVENPHRQVIEVRKHDDVIGLGKFRNTALCEADVNARMGILQKQQIVPGASGHSFLYRNPRSSKYLDVTSRIFVEQAIFEARSQHDVTRRGGSQEVSSSPCHSTNQCQDDHG